MNRQLRRLTAAAIALSLAAPAVAQNDSPFPVTGWTKGVDYEDRAQLTNRFGHAINPDHRGYTGGYDSPRQSTCQRTHHSGMTISGAGLGGGGGKEALVILPVLLVGLVVVGSVLAVTTAINNEICGQS